MRFNQANKIIFKKQLGFTFIELIVASAIIALIAIISVVNFHTARRSNDIYLAVDQVADSIITARNLSLGGQLLTNQTFPAGGYGVNFQRLEDKVFVYAATGADTTFDNGELLPGGTTEFSDIKIIRLCILTQGMVTNSPCGGSWTIVPEKLEIVFGLSGNITVNGINGPITGASYIGGVLQHEVTSRRAYFYVSLISGTVTGEVR